MPTNTTPFIIDFGTGTCHAGYNKKPSISFPNVNERREDGIFVGLDCITRPRSAFDRDFLTSHGAFDNSIEYIFQQLDVQEPPSKIAISETFCNPYACRAISSEVLFECYNIPMISYYVDTFTSYYHFPNKAAKSVVIDMGYFSTRVLAMQNNKCVYDISKCIPYGKNDCVELCMTLMHLKYPHLQIPRIDAESIVDNDLLAAKDYDAVLKELASKSNKYNIYKQYPYNMEEPLTSEEILSQKQRQQANRQRLIDMNLNKRKEKLEATRNQFLELNAFLEKLNNCKKSERLVMLKEQNYKSVDDVEEFIKTVEINIQRLEASIEKSENKMANMEDVQEEADVLDASYLQELINKRQLILQELETRKLDTTRRSTTSNSRMRGQAQIIDDSNKETAMSGDDFGMRDSDWNVYHDLKSQKQGLDIEIALAEIEEVLIRYAPNALTREENIISWLQYNGPAPVTFELHGRTLENVEFYNKNQRLTNQMIVNVERFKIAEGYFKPYLTGLDERGISEILNSIYDNHAFTNIYLTGGSSKLPGFSDRLLHDLESELPTNTKISIINDVENQAYIGAHDYYKKCNNDVYTTKEEYEEYGAEYLKVHAMSNPYKWYPETVTE